jgi:hypothetical protein
MPSLLRNRDSVVGENRKNRFRALEKGPFKGDPEWSCDAVVNDERTVRVSEGLMRWCVPQRTANRFCETNASRGGRGDGPHSVHNPATKQSGNHPVDVVALMARSHGCGGETMCREGGSGTAAINGVDARISEYCFYLNASVRKAERSSSHALVDRGDVG